MARWRKNEEAEDCNAERKPSINASKSTVEEFPMKDIKREEETVQADEQEPKLDLSLKLSLPVPDLNVPYHEPPSKGSSMGMGMGMGMGGSNKALQISDKVKTVTLSKLKFMGCQSCYKFVMVPEADRRCPWCYRDEYLIEITCETPAKKRKLI